MNKKGIFYFFIALIFVTTIITVFYFTNNYTFRDSQESVSARVTTMNDFIEDMNNDAEKATYIAAYRALIAMEEEIALTGTYFTDAETIFAETFFNGTLNGQNKTIMNASSFFDYIKRVNSTAKQIGVKIDIEIFNISLSHYSPWSIAVQIAFRNNVTDSKGIASWNYLKNQETMVPIYDLRDPFYTIATSGRVSNTIRQTNLSYFVNDVADANDTTNLISHTNQSYYVANTLAPDYLMRLEGNFSNSSNGIESLVFIEDLNIQGVVYDATRSIVDYILFNTNLTNASEVCSIIINTPSWFRIDRDHLETYEIDPKLGPEDEGYQCN